MHVRQKVLRTVVFAVGVILLALALIGPFLGLGEQYQFVLYRVLGLSRRATATLGALFVLGGFALISPIKEAIAQLKLVTLKKTSDLFRFSLLASRRAKVFHFALCVTAVLLIAVAAIAPFGEHEQFLFYRVVGLSRPGAFFLGGFLGLLGLFLFRPVWATVCQTAMNAIDRGRIARRFLRAFADLVGKWLVSLLGTPSFRRFIRRVPGATAYLSFLIVVVAVSSEIFLRFLLPAPQRYYSWPPHLHVVFNPSEEATPGIHGEGHFIANSLGLRSDEPWPDRERTIYVLGGSTSADVYLDQNEAWVQLFQTYLNAVPGQPKTWVGSLAKSGQTSFTNLLQFQYLVPELPRGDIFINLVGVNDLQLALKSSYLADTPLETWMAGTFSLMPSTGSFVDGLATFRFYKRIRDWLRLSKLGPVQTFEAGGYITWRKCRQTAPVDRLVGQLPDLTKPLEEYRQRLNIMTDRAKSYGAEMVFLTQTAIWAKDMAPEDSAVLLAGGVGPNNVWCDEQRYFSPAALSEGLNQFNEVLLSVCRERRLFCIDLGARVAKRRENFYDDMHFNEAGARNAARIVADEIAAHFPRIGTGSSSR